MARKVSPDTEVKTFDNVNVKTKGSFLRDIRLLWGNKTLGATKGFESYYHIRKFIAQQFSSLFTFDETTLLVSAFSDSATTLIQFLPIKSKILDTLETMNGHKSFRSCREKVNTLSELELVYLLLELERINTIRKYSDHKYLSFTEFPTPNA